ncbi:hypothetical protein EV195_1019 [Tenacibaculum skagerrakense]|uniref:Uncharacterized protein n=1 Tax=Tenacibaculum skagerrakense TaxID=186571 RepID=A0A4R2NZU5_9FLAO|nr:hypothetical protein [Tenacibaculum skagerrakense]TCP27850.1 hypothetical protein EV195_1019 [Tenacibaculum skagerrakense]
MNKIIPNHTPAPGWKGGFIEKHPELQYKDGVANLSTLPFNDNLDKIHNIKRQQRVLWPEFTWLTKHNDPASRCFQMFAPDISRAGYDTVGQNWAVICPQQGTYIEGFGTINVEVTVVKQRGWVNESDKSLAIDMVVRPKIWFSKDANQSAYGKLFWGAFELLNKLHHLPISKDQAIILHTHRTEKMEHVEDPEVIFVRDKLYTPKALDKLPSFTLHNNKAWNYANLEVGIGDIAKTGDEFVDSFNQLVMNLFNIGSGNLLQPESVLAWNVWVDAPTKVNQTEWRNHAQYWRTSIDVDHCSPDGNGSKVRYADGTEFSAAEELIKEALQAIWDFVKKHI